MATGRGAKPIDAAQASLRELCSVLESSESTPQLVTRNVLVNLNLGMVGRQGSAAGRGHGGRRRECGAPRGRGGWQLHQVRGGRGADAQQVGVVFGYLR